MCSASSFQGNGVHGDMWAQSQAWFDLWCVHWNRVETWKASDLHRLDSQERARFEKMWCCDRCFVILAGTQKTTIYIYRERERFKDMLLLSWWVFLNFLAVALLRLGQETSRAVFNGSIPTGRARLHLCWQVPKGRTARSPLLCHKLLLTSPNTQNATPMIRLVVVLYHYNINLKKYILKSS